MSFDIDQIKSNLQYGGARPTLYMVDITLPTGISLPSISANKFKFACEATSIPGSSQGTIRIPFMGRLLPYAGDTQFQPWTTTIINDEDFPVRNLIEDWLNSINSRKRNVRLASSSSPSLYKGSATIRQYDRVSNGVREYVMVDCYPTSITPIQLAWGSQNEIERFEVVWEYTWFDIKGSTATSLSDS